MFRRSHAPLGAQLTLLPTAMIMAIGFYGCLAWTFYISLTPSQLLPVYEFAGFGQYERLFANARWQTSLLNMFVFGVGFTVASLVIGFLLAVALDAGVRGEAAFRGLFLLPFALSFIIAGLAWRWLLDPAFGIEKLVRGWGFEEFRFSWITDPDLAIYCVIAAGVWRNAGLVMAVMLAALRGVNAEIWRAARVDGIPAWRVYLHVVIPMLRPAILTAVVLLTTAVVTSYDLVVAMTGGGPGFATDLPGKFVVDTLFVRSNLGLASAAAIVMLVALVGALAPYFLIELRRKPA
jgi:glucose/mannose transport system permease protein